MKTHQTLLILTLGLIGCTNSMAADPAGAEVGGGCSHDKTLPPLKLDAADQLLLAARSNPPKTAMDFYLRLPTSCFSNVENSPERRVTFVKKDSLKDQYLHAEHWFECDGGGFEATIRLFDTDQGPLIAILSSSYRRDKLLAVDHPQPGELQSITVNRPRFWRYRDSQWIPVEDNILPRIEKKSVLDQYHNRYKAHLKHADQQKYIWLQYDLPASGLIIPVTGRENFMDPSETYTWATFSFDGKSFLPTAKSEQVVPPNGP